MIASKEKNAVEELLRSLIPKNEEDKRTNHQRMLARTMFKNTFDKWYIKYLANLSKSSVVFSFINDDYREYDDDIWTRKKINYCNRLLPKYQKTIKNEIFSFNDDLKEKGLEIYKVTFTERYFCGLYLDMKVYIHELNDNICSIM